ncbi:hypothetical protein HPP92_007230 [Vanilla planifolia]|uniref:Mitochondrial glycoprotein n=1 Tax=Vanilla planifolia TaxID=51239 RepID=A0A835RQZ2_VANPL|nr:hypothetical protein HPP92_007230 [Vanilla planifolia]
MASSLARAFIRKTTGFSYISAFRFGCRSSLSYSSVAASSFSSSLVRRALKQSSEKPASLLSLRFASSKVGSDENLIKVLQSEIDCVQEPKDPRELDIPKGFPFEIIDNPGDQTITLKREFGGENIQVTVYMNLDEEEDVGKGDDESDDNDEEEVSHQASISLHVTIDKGEGPILEFGCNLSPDKLDIESMATKSREESDLDGAYQGPEFSDLDDNLQKALHDYLKHRGISGSLYNFLHEYMTSKDEREYLTWLKNIKCFVVS